MTKARNTDIVIGAEHLYSTYSEYIRAGFTEKQALKLIEGILYNSMLIQYLNSKDKKNKFPGRF